MLKKALIISFCTNKQFDKWFFVFVAYIEGKKIHNQPSIGSRIKFQYLSSGKSEPRDPGVIVLMMQHFI